MIPVPEVFREEIMVRRTIVSAALALTVSAGLLGARAQEAQTFVVGSHMPLTGALARSGQAFNEGMQVAATMCNAASPRHKIRIDVIDDESTPAKAVSAVEKLSSDGAVAIIGGYGSNIIGPASDAASKLGKVYITAGAVSDELTQRGLKNFFRINNNAGYQRGIATLLSDLKPEKISIVASTREAPALLADGLEKDLTAQGIKVTVHKFDPAISDFKPVINKIKIQDKPDIIMMSAYENDYVGIIRAAKVLKPNVKLIVGAWSLATPKMYTDFPDLMNNVVGTSFLPFPVEMKSEEGTTFADLYKSKYGKEIEYLSTLSFVETRILCEAIFRSAEAGTLAKGGLADEMRKTDRDTMLGRIQFDQSGDNPNFTLSMGQHRDGKIVLVSPRTTANGEIAYPGLPW
ncbi:ABC transporter substrate-binding protein [Roseomonas mucosa]|nr:MULTISPECIES: ABC transporter substrate-binding protein [Roseomonas]MDT8264330.1 ABC transporter substrate-binding protein [Roseomonas sp. DSM 102946]MCG7351236.1 ABC transporter substrate-binding protein [Roseomonas mucosa]MCG7356674.1 ABC transporter substrate-binding protein [Roseomonas mucosa]MDT8277989.1 ABC transporter substrate-binding protein [Roseomonas mucosa]MDT8291309.1 ABC transporter substrate-binding protein [Roseomonas mucosa]